MVSPDGGGLHRLPVPSAALTGTAHHEMSSAEQRRIVAKGAQLMTLVDELETQLAASRASTANLLSALVAKFTASDSALKRKP